MADDNDNQIEDDINDTADHVDDNEQEGGVFRWMSVVVVLLAIAGFFGLAWYAYKSGGDVTDDRDAELILADSTPVKEEPVNPGGMPIPNQDKTVYGLVGGKSDEGKVVEHILASPETPITHAEEPETGTWMSDQVKEKLKSVEQAKGSLPPAPASAPAKEEDEQPEKPTEAAVSKVEQFNPAKAHDTVPQEVHKTPVDVAPVTPPVAAPVKSEAAKPETPKAETPKAEAPKAETPKEAVKEVAAEVKKPEVKPVAEEKAAVDKKPAEEKLVAVAPVEKKAPPAKAASTTPPSGARAQLGAFKSEAEAEGQWKKISKKYSDEIGDKSHYIIRADLGEKGVFYRLQLAPFGSSKDVDHFCFALVSNGQGCFPAKGK